MRRSMLDADHQAFRHSHAASVDQSVRVRVRAVFTAISAARTT